MKTKLTFLILLSLALTSPARIGNVLSYDELKAKATLIVIAMPIQVTVTEQLAPIGTSNMMGKETVTTFTNLTVLKGDLPTNTFLLHHFTLANPRTNGTVYTDFDPRLVSFNPKDTRHTQYLMFLQKEADGRYAAVSGQYDPADSIFVLFSDYLSAYLP